MAEWCWCNVAGELNYSIVAKASRNTAGHRQSNRATNCHKFWEKSLCCCLKVTRRGFQKSVTTFHEFTDSDHHVVKSARHCIHERVHRVDVQWMALLWNWIVIQRGLCPSNSSWEVCMSVSKLWCVVWVKSGQAVRGEESWLEGGCFALPCLTDISWRGESDQCLAWGMGGSRQWLDSLGTLLVCLLTLAPAGGQQCSHDHQKEAFSLQTQHRWWLSTTVKTTTGKEWRQYIWQILPRRLLTRTFDQRE